MKTIPLILTACAALGLNALADVGVTTVSFTNTLAKGVNTSNSTVNTAVDISKVDTVALELRGQASQANGSNVVVVLQRSADKAYWEFPPVVTWTPTFGAAGSTNVCLTNLPATLLSGYGWLRVMCVSNTDTVGDLTNCGFRVFKKTVKPSP
jgi:hypothetical protein